MANSTIGFLNMHLEKFWSKFPKNKLDNVLVKFVFLLFMIGILLPTNWRQLLGNVGYPISWIAMTIPSIKKAAAISPISELLQGFFGIAFF